MRTHLLPLYLRDHHAASAAGVALATRLAREASTEPFGSELAALAAQITSDRATLEEVMQAMEVEPNPVKVALARMAERASRLKLNGRLLSRSPLSRVIELEGLGAGIHAKRDLWTTLEQVAYDETDFAELRRRADEQLAVVERLRSLASERVFGVASGRPG
jgi:hypothetical protein